MLDNPRVDEIYGLHLTTQDKAGTVNIRRGPTMASGDGFNVEVTGKGGHGAYPHLSVDPMTAAAHILIGMQSLVSKEVAAKETVVLSVGQILAGTKNNIIPDKAVMRGTLRTFDLNVREQMLGRLQSFVVRHGARLSRGGAARSHDGLPARHQSGAARRSSYTAAPSTSSGESAVVEGSPVMASDDMSLFLRARPGCYFRVGIAPTHSRSVPHHAPEFEMNEAGLPVGLRLALACCGVASAPKPSRPSARRGS